MPVRLRLLAAAALVLTGCFQTDVVLTVRPDGSARLVETVALEGILGLGVPVSLRELGPPTLPGAELAGFATAERPGGAVTTATWEIADLDGFRYDLRDAGRVATMLRGLAAWSRGQEDIPPHAPAELRFAVEPGATTRLGVTVGRTLGAAELARLPWHPAPEDAALGMAFGYDGPFTDELRAELRAELGSFAPGQLGPEDFLSDVAWVQAAEALVLGGTASARFTVLADGELLESEGGWREGDRWLVADVHLAEAFGLDARAALADSAAAARFDAETRAAGFDRPGLRVPPAGELSLRFR